MKINKELLKKAEEEGLVNSTDKLWNFLEKSKKSSVSILNIIGVSLIIFGILLISFMFIEMNNQEVAGIIIVLTGLSLNYIVDKINKSDMTFKIGNLVVYLLLCFGVLTASYNLLEKAEDLGLLFYYLKIIEIPAILLACYFYVKNKNEYILIIPFLIISAIAYMWIDISVEYYVRKYIWLNKVSMILIYMSLIVLLMLTYFKKLVTKENVEFVGLAIMFNAMALIYFFDMYGIFSKSEQETLAQFGRG